MKGIAITRSFRIEDLEWVNHDIPRPGPGELLVRLKAVSLNFRDLHVIEGVRKVPLPLIPLSDGAGDVVEVGPGAGDFKAGDRVMTCFAPGWLSGPQPAEDPLKTLGGPLQGVLVEYRIFRHDELVQTPEFLSDEEAATLPCAAVSAWNALFVSGNVKPGDSVVLQGTGGVSLFALQFARLAGAKVVITSSSDEKLARAAAMGADHCINYRTHPDWAAEVRTLLPAGADYVVEVGGSGTLAQSLRAVRNGGQISFVGFLSGVMPDFDLSQIGMKSIQLKGIRVGNRASHQSMCKAIVQHKVRPCIDTIHAFKDSLQAIAQFKQGGHFGKVCIRLD